MPKPLPETETGGGPQAASAALPAAGVSRRPAPYIYQPPIDPWLTVLHADSDILVLDKPSRLLSVPGKGVGHEDCLEARARDAFPSATTVHRLDKDTSGLMVMALNPKAHRHLGLQFERRKLSKTYLARVWGEIADNSGRIDLPLACDWPNRPRQHVDHLHGRAATTDWEIISRGAGIARVRLHPLTGRSHQLRVHMLSIGHPILGDPIYATGEALRAAERLQLHAAELTFFHPSGGQVCTFRSDCPF